MDVDDASRPSSPNRIRVVTVAKVLGGEWFDRMEFGIRELAEESAVDAWMTGADDLSPEKQAKIIDDLILTQPTAITVVPNAPDALEEVLGRARRAGIIVVTHEATNQVNTDADIEAFDNAAYGARMMASLASCMAENGKYVAFIGHNKAQSHVEWADGASEWADSHYPGIERVGDPIETFEKAEIAYRKTKALLVEHPDVKGFLGTGSTDVVGIGQAVREAGLQDKTCVVGTSIPSMANEYLADGSIDKIFFWDPSLAGKAQVLLALMLSRGETITSGSRLPLAGYENLQLVTGRPRAFHGDAWVEVDRTNAAQYPF